MTTPNPVPPLPLDSREGKPVRLQRRRAKGFRLVSPNGLPIVCVTRPGPFGNPFTVARLREIGYAGTDDEFHRMAVGAFRVWLSPQWWTVWSGSMSKARRDHLLSLVPSLRGKNVACYCEPDRPCHGDVLIELAAIAPESVAVQSPCNAEVQS